MQNAIGVTYLHGDHLGSTSVATDSGGAKISRQTYYAFGAVRTTEGTLPTDYTFTGQKNDSYIKLTQMGARRYDSDLGRFIQPDSIIPNLYNPQSLNRYSYAFNNPVRYTDPSGHDPFDSVMNFLAGMGAQWLYINTLTVNAQLAPKDTDTRDITLGRHAGNLLAIAQGLSEFEGALAMIAGGTAAGAATCLETIGAGCIAGVVVDAAGATMAAHGATVVIGGAVVEGGMIGDATNRTYLDLPEAAYKVIQDGGYDWWQINQAFLDEQIKAGKTFFLETSYENALKSAGGMDFKKEIDYLLDKGYKFTEDGTKLVPGGNTWDNLPFGIQ